MQPAGGASPQDPPPGGTPGKPAGATPALPAIPGACELNDGEMDGVPEGARERLREALREGGTLEAKVSAGGTSSARLSEQLDEARRALADLGA